MFYGAQRNIFVSLARKAKQETVDHLGRKKISDNKTFWKTITPFSTNKRINKERIALVENGEILLKNQKFCEILNT